ncbi:MAG: ParB/RepB/Spo0J family partition protein [Prevotellaceae bacterium]|jgi:ParB family chromosome partitioning protein|nr:ParB/RepB/Spo0J family partition protein [Prevotellaceae bacterium]
MAQRQRPALGRGIGALLDDAGVVTQREPKERIAEEPAFSDGSEIAIEAIEPNPHQPRKHFDDDALQELSDSIKSLGVIQPITVHKLKNGKFQIISGERRYRAARMAGLETIPVFVRTSNDDEKNVLICALVENIQREDLNALEIAVTYQRLMEEGNLTQEELSGRIGKKRSTVANYLRLLQQPAEVQAAIREGNITMGHARAIAGLAEDKDQVKVVRKTVDEGLSVRQVEELVKKLAQPKEVKKQPEEAVLPEIDSALTEAMKRCFNVRIAIKRNNKGKGSIAIPFRNDEEMNEFLAKLNNFTG